MAKIDEIYKRLAYENAKLNSNKCKEDTSRYQTLRTGDAVSETHHREKTHCRSCGKTLAK